MAYDEVLAGRVSNILETLGADFSVRKMMGGIMVDPCIIPVRMLTYQNNDLRTNEYAVRYLNKYLYTYE